MDYNFYMNEALKLAKKAYKKDEVPVGAIIVKENKILARAFNLRQSKRRATYNAEILAINKACKKLKDFRLNGATIFVTLEPCAMCLGAIMNARIETLVFGATANKENVISCSELAERCGLNHNLKIIKDVQKEECEKLITSYFAEKRK